MAAWNADEEIFTGKELKEYFRVHLMYGTLHDQWPKKTLLHFCVKLSQDSKKSQDILKLLQTKFRQSKLESTSLKGKLYNQQGKHAEQILLENLESAFNPDDVSKLSEGGFNKDDKSKYSEDGLNKDDMNNLSDILAASSLTPSRVNKTGDKAEVEIDLLLIMNYAPCNMDNYKCADKIRTFKEKMGKKYGIRITIIFGSFYKVYNGDNHGHLIGLANLLNAGIELQLVWDVQHLIQAIKNLHIGTDETMTIRQQKDNAYLQRVRDKATEIRGRPAQGEPYK